MKYVCFFSVQATHFDCLNLCNKFDTCFASLKIVLISVVVHPAFNILLFNKKKKKAFCGFNGLSYPITIYPEFTGILKTGSYKNAHTFLLTYIDKGLLYGAILIFYIFEKKE